MRSSFIRPVAALGGAVLCATMTAGCHSGDDGDNGSALPSPGVRQVDLNKPIVTQDVPVPGTEGDHVTVGVLSLEEQGGLMVLNLVFTPDFTSVSEGGQITLANMLGKADFGPWLFDSKNLKVYSGLGDGLTSSGDGPRTVNGQPLYAWATFAPPEDGAESFDVYVQTAWPAFTDIPVVR